MTAAAPLQPRDRLIVALDVPSVLEAEALIDTLGNTVGFYKIGYQLAFAGGIPLAHALVGAGKRVFLDMKLHDIGNTVERGVAAVARMGVSLLTVHAYPQTMRAAVAAKGSSGLAILAVTALTSYDDADLAEAGYAMGVSELVDWRAEQAREAGVDGLVCAAEEAPTLRQKIGPDMLLVTPGIRPAGAGRGDQKRVATPAQAVAAGADYLVVGRPIVEAADPRAATAAIIDEIAEAT